MIVTAHDAEDYGVFLDFARKRGAVVPMSLHPMFKVIGRADDRGELQAVVEFNGFSKRTCQVHVTGRMTPDLIRAMFKYAFRTCNFVQIFGHISEKNHNLRALAQFLGFHELARILQGWDDSTDLILVCIHRKECRWLKEH